MRMLIESGVLVQNADGSFTAFSLQAAREQMAALGPERRAFYE